MSSPVSRTAAPLRVSSTRVSGRLPDFPWDTIADAKATAQAHADGIVDLSVGTPVDPVAGMPEVTLDADGVPTVTVPDTEAPADLLARTLVRAEVMVAIRERFPPGRAHAG